MAPPSDRPSYGLRLTLDLVERSDDGVIYRGDLTLASGEEIVLVARFDPSADAPVALDAHELDEATLRYVTGICRQIANGGRTDGVWPRRVRRWRELSPSPLPLREVLAMTEHASARAWMERDPDPTTRATVAEWIATGNVAELASAFSARLAFGTAGLRGRIGAGPARMNRLVVRESSLGLADYLAATFPDARERGVVVARDARRGSPEFAHEAAAAFVSRGFRVFLLDAPTATPMTARQVVLHGTVGGVMVTASHNPPDDNGYKVYWENGAQIIEPHDAGIAAAIDAVAAAPLPALDVDALLGSDRITLLTGDDERRWIDEVVARTAFASAPNRAALRIAYSAMHGVGAHLVEPLLERLGYAPLFVVEAQHAPDGSFPTVHFPNPEEPGALDMLHARATAADAHLAIAHDPDADRLAVCVPRADGTWRTLTGDETGALLGDFLLARTEGPRAVGTTIVSSRLLAAIAAHYGAQAFQTLTGFKWIANRAMALERDGVAFVFGYEEAIGFTIGDLVRDKDGLSAAAVVADLAATAHANGRTLDDALDAIYARHGVYATRQRSQALAPGQRGSELTNALRAALPTTIAGRAVVARADLRTGETHGDWGSTAWDLPASDVLVFLLDDQTRVIARPSGTEPKVKFYYEVIEAVDGEPVSDVRERANARLADLVARHAEELDAVLRGGAP